MPTYAYACTQCDHTFDLVQSFSEDPLTICPECEGRLRKVYGSIGITFKGSGFYRTDSRASASRNGERKPASESSAPKANGSAGSSSGKDSSAGSSTSANAAAS